MEDKLKSFCKRVCLTKRKASKENAMHNILMYEIMGLGAGTVVCVCTFPLAFLPL